MFCLLLQLIHCYLFGKDKTWDQDLQLVASVICSMQHKSTGFSVNIMMLGMEMFQPVNILFCTVNEEFRYKNPAGYVQHLCKTVGKVHEVSSMHLNRQLRYQKHLYDLKLLERHYKVAFFSTTLIMPLCLGK